LTAEPFRAGQAAVAPIPRRFGASFIRRFSVLASFPFLDQSIRSSVTDYDRNARTSPVRHVFSNPFAGDQRFMTEADTARAGFNGAVEIDTSCEATLALCASMLLVLAT
jgi:hypothetical protein